jgi:glutaconate CoA-transferase subunit B
MEEVPTAAPEQMVVCMARLLRDGETVFHGVASPLPMVAILLAKWLHAPRLVYLNVGCGVDPAPSRLPLSTVSPATAAGTTSIFPLAEIFDLAARGGLDVAFLGGAEIDRHGRINLSVIGDPRRPRVRLPGGAGAAALMPTAGRTILWRTRHTPQTFVERVSFVTAQGRVDRVVTPLCVFVVREGALVVESIHPYASPSEVRRQTGFAVDVSDATRVTPSPTGEELAALAAVDPERVRAIEFID